MISHYLKKLILILILTFVASLFIKATSAFAAYKVCIDPGHGGSVKGAVANGLVEKEVNLDVALRLNYLLQINGFETVMTRSADISPNTPPVDRNGDGKITYADDLKTRVDIANGSGVSIFMSIHHNAASSSSASGTETLYNPNSALGRALALLVQEELIRGLGRVNRGIQERSNIYVLNHTNMPAALSEGAFLTNSAEAALLKTDSFRQAEANAICNGIIRYFFSGAYYYGAGYVTNNTPPTMPAGSIVRIPNTIAYNWGTGTWNRTYFLGYHWEKIKGDGTTTMRVWDDGGRNWVLWDIPTSYSITLFPLIKTPNQSGKYKLVWDMAQDGIAFFSQRAVPCDYDDVSIIPMGSYGCQWISHSTPSQMGAGQTMTNIPITIKNTGAFTWEATGPNAVHLSYHWVNQAGQTVVWEGARSNLPGNIAPRQETSFLVSVTAPAQPGYYTLYYDLAREGVTWFSQQGVREKALTVQVVSGYGVQWVSHNTPTQVYAGQIISAGINFTIRNTGIFTWQTENSDPNPIRLSYHWVDRAGRVVVWDGVRSGLPGDIAPGEVTTFLGSLVVPQKPGYYTLYWDLVQEGRTWFSWKGCSTANLTVHVVFPHNVQWISHNTPSQMYPGQVIQDVRIRIKNSGVATWQTENSDPNPIRLSYHWVDRAGRVVVWDGVRSGIPGGDLAAGQQVTFAGSVVAPSQSGYYTLYWDLVQEGVTWFSWQGCPSQALTVRVISQIMVRGNGPFQVVRASDNAVLTTLGRGQTCGVAFSRGNYLVNTSTGFAGITPSPIRLLPSGPTIMEVLNMPAYRWFRGGIEIRYSTHTGKLWAINELGMQDYCKGIGEEPESYPYQGLMAAVVAYRSYAWAVKLEGKYANEPFDISSSTSYQHYTGADQWYIGYHRETLGGNLSQAVDDRYGEVLLHPQARNSQKVARTPYFSCCGGQTKTHPTYAWSRSVSDPFCVGHTPRGHGYGMCMHGAWDKAAQQGWLYDRILGFYYTGVSKSNIGNPIIRIGVYSAP